MQIPSLERPPATGEAIKRKRRAYFPHNQSLQTYIVWDIEVYETSIVGSVLNIVILGVPIVVQGK